MRCNHCKAEWTVSEEIAKKLVNCPFCGQSLLPPKPVTPETLTDALVLIADRYGMDTLRDGYRTVALFLDLAPGLRREKTMLSYLVQVNGHTDLIKGLQADPAEQTILLGKAASRMVDNCLIAQSLAEEICRSFWQAIGGAPAAQRAASIPERAKKPETEAQPEADTIPKGSASGAAALALYNEYQTIVNRQSARNILSREIQDLEAEQKKHHGQTSALQEQLKEVRKQQSHLEAKIQAFQDVIQRSSLSSATLQDHRKRLQEARNELQTLKAKETGLQRQIASDPLPILSKHLISMLDDQIRQKQDQLNQLRKKEYADSCRMKALRNELSDPRILRELAWQPEKAALLQKDPAIRAALIRMKP